MIWQNGELKNPFSGKPLRKDSAHSLTDGHERFPIITEIPFLRAKRDELKNETLRALDLNDERAALTLLWQDQDDWARSQPPSKEDLQALFDNQDLTLREAMQHLKYGAVADYFAYRWSDPTFLSGLDLLEWHLPNETNAVFELCCGIGHYLREFALRGIEATGADVVFSKLWLARKFVAPEAKLVCCDANFALPFADNVFDAAFCHDAFYFLPEKQFVADELRRISSDAIIIGHTHNSDADNFSSGAPVSVNEYAYFLENPDLYDDEELTRSTIENRKPKRARTLEELQQTAAIAIVEAAENVQPHNLNFTLPPKQQSLRINPLLLDESENTIRETPLYPSERYEKEYAPLSDYLNSNGETLTQNDLERAKRGEWRDDTRLTNLARRRILLDLPEKW